MLDSLTFFLQSAEETLRVTYAGGGITWLNEEHTTGWRTLPDAMLAFMVGCETTISFKGAADLLVRPGEAVFLPPGLTHCVVNQPPSISYWSHFSCTIFASADLFSYIELPTIYTGAHAQQLKELNAQLAHLLYLQSTFNRLTPALLFQKKSLLFQLLARLLEQAQLSTDGTKERAKQQQLYPVLEYIEMHLASPLTREELARQVHLSPSRFGNLFQATLGLAPGEYIQRRRLARAQQLLRGTTQTIREIAHAVGYPDAFHFSRLFKSHYGYSPAHWRKM